MRNTRFFGFLVLFVAAALGATAILGQSLTTTALRGKVDNESAGLPGVTVTLTSPSLQGTRTAVTSVNGDFTFVGIPPGQYTVTFALQGFKSVTKTVGLTAGQQNIVDATLSLTEVTATAVVSARADIVSTTTQASTTITSELSNKLPITRTIASAAALSSGVNTVTSLANALTVSGAPTFDNLYTVDGAVITDNIRATPNNLYIEDAIQEYSTSANSVSAEYGRFQGGVINTVTKSGGNTFQGSFRTTLTNDAWSAITPANEVRLQDVLPRYEATLGGPIWKDHVWFFGAFRKADTTQAQVTNSITAIPFTFGDSEKRYQGKLTLTPFTNHSLTGAYLKINDSQTNYVYPDAAHVMDTASFTNRQLPQDTLSLNYNGVLTSQLFVEGLYSNRHFTFENSGSQYTDLINGTLMRDRAAGNIRYNAPTFCGVCGPEKRDNRDYLIKGTYFLSTGSLGSHNIVVGYDNFAGERSANNYQSGSNYRLFTTNVISQGGDLFPVIGANSYVYYTPIYSLTHGTNTLTNSAFLNDSWRLSDRLTFNLGVRYDKNNAQNSNGATTANDSAFSPRLAANFDVTGKGNVRVGASYAHYVGGLQDAIQDSSSSGGQPATFYWYYTGAGATPINCIPNGTGCTLPPAGTPLVTRAQALQQVFNWFFAQGCPDLSTCKLPLSYASVPGLNRLITTTLKSPYAREYTFGVNGNMGSSFSYRADFVRRDFHDFYNLVINQQTGSVHDVTGKAYDLGIIGNTNDVQRNYTGLQTQFQYRYKWLVLGANWTWSHTLGNFDGENATSGPLTNSLDTYPEYKQASWNQPYGSMATDQRHKVRLIGSADLGILPPSFGNLSVGLVQAYDTGAPYGAVGTVASRNYVTNPGYATRPSSVTYYYTPRDAFRTDNISRTDLSLNYQVKIGGLVEIFVQPQVLNLFNNQGLVAVDTTVNTAVSAGAFNGVANKFAPFNPFTTTPVQRPHGDTTVTTANWDTGQNFGKARNNLDYQLPRTFTLTMGLRF
ncbi:MAG: TonB-dependent receptor domain-containing protein [Thermoanaerobaculia bacterium]